MKRSLILTIALALLATSGVYAGEGKEGKRPHGAGGPHEFGATTICFTSSGKVIIGYDWHRIPWERNVKTGGVRLAILDKEWFNRAPVN